MKSHSALLSALFFLAFFVASSSVAQNGPVEKRYAGSFRDDACTVTLQWVTTDGSVNVSGSLTTQSGAALKVSGAEISPGMLELTVETDESINHKLSLADAGGKAIWAGTYLTFIETGSPVATPTGAAMPPTGAAPAPGLPTLPPLPPLGGGLSPLPGMPQLPATGTAPTAPPAVTGTPPSPPTGGTTMPPPGGGLPPLPPLPGTGTTVGTTMPPAPGTLNPGVPTGSIPGATSGPAQEIRLTPTVWPVGKWPEGMAHDGNFLWVAESGQRTLAHINPDTGAIAERVKAGRLPVGMATNPVTGDVFADVGTDKVVVKFSRGAKGGKFGSLSDYPQDIVADETAVWVLMWIDGTANTGKVIRFDQRSGASSKSDLIGDAVSNIGVSENRLWVNQATPETTRLNLLDPATLQISQTMSLNGYFPSLAVTSKSILMAGGEWDAYGMVVRVDPITMQETGRKQLGDEFIFKVTNNEQFLVAAGSKGTLWILSATDLSLLRTIRLDWRPFQPASLLIDHDVLYISTAEGNGEEGSILVLKDWAPEYGHP